ncbi:MAG: tyrosine-type recombinase/integrase, partial [Clostridiaceae bacterium]
MIENNMKNVINAFLDNLIPGEEATLSTYVAYREDLILFANFLKDYEKITDIRKISTAMIYDFRKYLYEKKGFLKSTVDRKIFCLRSFFKYLVDYDYLNKNPMNKFKHNKKARSPITDFLTENELDIICNTPRKMNIIGYEKEQALIYALRYTGGRRGTIRSLNWDDIHFFDSKITITIGKQVRPEKHPIPMHKRLRDALLVYYKRIKPNDNDPVFTSKTGNRISNTEYTKTLRKIIDASGVKKEFTITGHSFRSAFITLLVQKGWTLADIQALTFHKDAKTLYEYYFKTNQERMKASIAAL